VKRRDASVDKEFIDKQTYRRVQGVDAPPGPKGGELKAGRLTEKKP